MATCYRSLDRRYDLIIHDCFTGGTEPTHLLAREMLSELRNLLNEGGILALNYVGFMTGEGSDAVAAVHRTLKGLFPYIRVFTTEKIGVHGFCVPGVRPADRARCLKRRSTDTMAHRA